jgi:hypothetical protein
VTSLETILNAVRDADSISLPDIIREIRSGGEDVQYYAPLTDAGPGESRATSRTGFANDTTGSPLVELGKIMGTLQLEEGQVEALKVMGNIRCGTLDLPPIYLLSQQSLRRHYLLNRRSLIPLRIEN